MQKLCSYLLILFLLLNSISCQDNMNCGLVVPPFPLTPQGLATPYVLSPDPVTGAACSLAVTVQQVFVEAAIYDPNTGNLAVYQPLVINKGTTPLVAPTPPTLPTGAVVAIWFGFNGGILTLIDGGQQALITGQCVNGLPGDPFGEFAACNAKAFFAAINTNPLPLNPPIPALGNAVDGLPCPTTRDFSLVDQDPSDNVVTSYIMAPNGQTCQNTVANTQNAVVKKTSATNVIIVNGSDNRLLTFFVDTLLGCTSYMVPDIGNNGQLTKCLACNELMAAARQQKPLALIPRGDPMVKTNNLPNLNKVNAYRTMVNQPNATSLDACNTRAFCWHLAVDGATRLNKTQFYFNVPNSSPDPAVGNTLFTFLAQRFFNTWGLLMCDVLFDSASPFQTTQDANGVAVAATFNQTIINNLDKICSPDPYGSGVSVTVSLLLLVISILMSM